MTTPLDCIFLPAGTRLFSEGDAGDHAYLIRAGQIEIVVERQGQEVVIARRGPGEIIGEMALLDSGTRSASARVAVEVEVVAISLRQLEQRIRSTDPILRMCLGVVIERYRETLHMARTGASPAPAREAKPRPIGRDFHAAVAALTLEREIERALERQEFELFLQPIVRLADRSLAGFEALIRWHHPERGLVQPSEFIPTAETSGLVVHITEWVLRETIRVMPILLEASGDAGRGTRGRGDPLFVSMNVSGRDIFHPGFADSVMRLLKESRVAPHHLKLEITESMLMKDPAGAGRILAICRDYGVGIAVDDFGTGYSSLSHLSTLPITTLKIDRGFVRAMQTDATSRKIISTIRLLARELEMPVVAEGIESEADATLLAAMHCEFGQGYLFGKPAPLASAVALLEAEAARPLPTRRLRA